MNASRALVFAALGAMCLSGCVTAPSDPAARAEFRANHDPLEPLNRRTFAFNLYVDRKLIKPVAQGYGRLLPLPVRDGLRHFLDNLNEPIILANDILQWRWNSAATTSGRLVVNSTLGIAGFSDFASRHRMPRQSGDFGQTLSRWGFGEGPYLIIPVFGPSNPRDIVGKGADTYADLFRYLTRNENYFTSLSISRVAIDGIDERQRNIAALDEMQHEAVDYYASFRSLYRQNRAAEVKSGSARAGTLTPPGADLYDDPGR